MLSLSLSLSHTHTHTHTHTNINTHRRAHTYSLVVAALWLERWSTQKGHFHLSEGDITDKTPSHNNTSLAACVVCLCVFHMHVCCPPKTRAIYHSLQPPVRPLSLHIRSLVSTCGLMHWTFQPICQAAWRWKSPGGGKKPPCWFALSPWRIEPR